MSNIAESLFFRRRGRGLLLDNIAVEQGVERLVVVDQVLGGELAASPAAAVVLPVEMVDVTVAAVILTLLVILQRLKIIVKF